MREGVTQREGNPLLIDKFHLSKVETFFLAWVGLVEPEFKANRALLRAPGNVFDCFADLNKFLKISELKDLGVVRVIVVNRLFDTVV